MKKNKRTGSALIRCSLDLHGKTVSEAEVILDGFLHRLSGFEGGRARIVMGKGTGAIRTFVMWYVRKAGYPFEFEKLSNGKSNDGVIILFLD